MNKKETKDSIRGKLFMIQLVNTCLINVIERKIDIVRQTI